MPIPETKAKIPTTAEFSAQVNNTGVEKERGDATVKRSGVNQATQNRNQTRVIPGQSLPSGIRQGDPRAPVK